MLLSCMLSGVNIDDRRENSTTSSGLIIRSTLVMAACWDSVFSSFWSCLCSLSASFFVSRYSLRLLR